MTDFSQFDLDPKILSALGKMGFEKPSPIQSATLPLILKGQDIIAMAETGSGKTAACAIPICQTVDVKRPEVQALIIVPTRELCLQYAMETQNIGREKGVKAFAMYGGEDMSLQTAKLKAGVQVLVATPGRLIDLIHSRLIDLSHVETFILDEADEMLSMGFVEDLEFIIQCLVHEHRTLLFSATMPPAIAKLARQYMNEPHEIKLIAKRKSPKNLKHRFVYVKNPRARSKVLASMIQELRPHQCLVFCQSRRQVEEVCRFLKGELSGVDFLHGGLAQNLRSSITSKFRTGKIRNLVVTDVAARGLDFSGVTHVFIYQLGRDIDTYVHRSGRTGRSGREGLAISLITDHELSLVPRVAEKVEKEVSWIGEPPPEATRRQGGGGRPDSRRRPRSSGARGSPPRGRRGAAPPNEQTP